MKLPVVSITFQDDIRLTFLQIASFDRLFEKNRLGTFYIVIDDRAPDAAEQTKQTLGTWFESSGMISDSSTNAITAICQ